MALAFDAKTDNLIASNPVTVSHTCTGSELILIVGISDSNSAAATVTYNGVAMTKAVQKGVESLQLWYLINPATGAHNVVATASTSFGGGGLGTLSLTGAKQSAQPDATNSGSTTANATGTATITTVADNCFTVSCWYCTDNGSMVAGNTHVMVQNAGYSGMEYKTAKTPAGAETNTMSNGNPGENWGWVILSVADSSAGAGGGGAATTGLHRMFQVF